MSTLNLWTLHVFSPGDGMSLSFGIIFLSLRG